MTDEEMAGAAPAGGLTDEQMMAPEEGGPESFLDPKKFKPSAIHRKFANTGSTEQVRGDIQHLREGMPTDAEAVTAPIYDLLDKASLGLLSATARQGERLHSQIYGEGAPGPGASIDTAINRYRQEAPTLSNITSIPAYLTPGTGPSKIAAGVERALPQATAPWAQAARAVLGAGASSGLTAGAEAAIRGEDLPEVARETGRGAAGGVAIGAPLSGLGLLMKGAANAVLGSKGAKAREYLESRGQPLTAPDTSDAAIGAASQRTDEAVKQRLAEYKGEVATKPYTEAIDAIPQSEADKVVNVTPIYRDLQMAANDPANLQVADKLNMLVKMLGDRPIMTQSDLNGLRRSLAGIAGVGETTAAKQAPLRRAYESVKALVDQGPYAEANRRFTQGMGDFNESLGMVGLRSSTNPEEPIKGNLRVASQRQGQNTVTAGADTERLDVEAFKAKHPELANVIDAPEIIRRQGDLAFNAAGPSHGGFIERHGMHLSPFVMAAIAAAGHGLKGAAAIPLALALQNRNAIAGRVLYNPAQNAQIAAQMLLGQVPQLALPGSEALQERR